MISEIKKLLDNHWRWLRDKTQVRSIDNQWVEITTPYIDRHNDMLQIFARRESSGFVLTDDGYIISDLLHSGCKLDTPKRQSLLNSTLAGFGVQNKEGRLEVYASESNFSLRKHNLIQSMLAVNDLFCLSAQVVGSLFYEDVLGWLDLSDIRFTPSVKFTGKSGFDHLFEFVIPKSKSQPERILQAINRPTRDSAETLAFKWIDSKDARSSDARAYAILNDQDHSIPEGVLNALLEYGIHPIKWSSRATILSELAA